MTPQMKLEVDWEGERAFGGCVGDVRVVLDGKLQKGPSPMHAIAFGLVGCMGIDLVHILEKARQPVQALHAELVGSRAAEEPKRFLAFDLHFTVTGDIAPDHVDRAIALSREKYCSVWHSLRQDIVFTVSYDIKRSS